MERKAAFLMFILLLPIVAKAENPSGKPKEEESPDRRPGWTAGLGAIYITRAYKASDDRFVPLPFLSYRGPRLVVLGPRASYTLIQAGPVKASVAVAWRFAGYDPDDSRFLNGMEKRRDTLEAGASSEMKLPAQFSLQADWRVDTLGRHNGYETAVGLRRAFQAGRFRLVPVAEWTYLSSNLADTYYGVRPSEATALRPAYRPGPAQTLSTGITVFYRTRENVSLLLGWRITRLPNELTDSPIVSERVETRTMAGIMWNLKSRDRSRN